MEFKGEKCREFKFHDKLETFVDVLLWKSSISVLVKIAHFKATNTNVQPWDCLKRFANVNFQLISSVSNCRTFVFTAEPEKSKRKKAFSLCAQMLLCISNSRNNPLTENTRCLCFQKLPAKQVSSKSERYFISFFSGRLRLHLVAFLKENSKSLSAAIYLCLAVRG